MQDKLVDLQPLVTLARSLNPDFTTHVHAQFLKSGSDLEVHQLQLDLNWQVFLKAGEWVEVSYQPQSAIVTLDQWVIRGGSLRPIPYLKSQVWSGEAKKTKGKRSQGGIAYGPIACVDPEVIAINGRREYKEVLSQTSGSLPQSKLRSMLIEMSETGEMDEDRYVQMMRSESALREELRHVKAFRYAEVASDRPLIMDMKQDVIIAEKILRSTSTIRHKYWASESSKEQPMKSIPILELESKLGGLIDHLEELIANGHNRMAYAFFLRFLMVHMWSMGELSTISQDPHNERFYYLLASQFFFTSTQHFLNLPSSTKTEDFLNSLFSRVKDSYGFDTSANEALKLMKEVYRLHFLTDAERLTSLRQTYPEALFSQGQGGTIGRWKFENATFDPQNGNLILHNATRIPNKQGEVESQFLIDGRNLPRDIVLKVTRIDQANLNPPNRLEQVRQYKQELKIDRLSWLDKLRKQTREVPVWVIMRDGSSIWHRIYGVGTNGTIFLREEIFNEGSSEQIKEALDHEWEEVKDERTKYKSGHDIIRNFQYKGGLTSLIKRLVERDNGAAKNLDRESFVPPKLLEVERLKKTLAEENRKFSQKAATEIESAEAEYRLFKQAERLVVHYQPGDIGLERISNTGFFKFGYQDWMHVIIRTARLLALHQGAEYGVSLIEDYLGGSVNIQEFRGAKDMGQASAYVTRLVKEADRLAGGMSRIKIIGVKRDYLGKEREYLEEFSSVLSYHSYVYEYLELSEADRQKAGQFIQRLYSLEKNILESNNQLDILDNLSTIANLIGTTKGEDKLIFLDHVLWRSLQKESVRRVALSMVEDVEWPSPMARVVFINVLSRFADVDENVKSLLMSIVLIHSDIFPGTYTRVEVDIAEKSVYRTDTQSLPMVPSQGEDTEMASVIWYSMVSISPREEVATMTAL